MESEAREVSPESLKGGIKGVLSKSRRTGKTNASKVSINGTDASSDSHGIRSSIDSARDKLRPSRGSSLDDGLPAGPSGMSKLIPGRIQKKRKERKAAKQQRKEQEEADDLEVDDRGRSVMDQTATSADAKQRSQSTLGESSLMTNDSDIEIPLSPPPLVSRQSHVGYLTSSSPLIKTTAIEDTPSTVPLDGPTFQTPQYHKSSTFPNPASTSTLPTNLALQHATTMDTRKASTTKEAENHPESRGISPGARIKDVFKPGSRKKEDSPPISPDRTSLVSNENSNTYGSLLKGAGRKSTFKTRKASKVPDSQAVISPDIQPKTPNSSTRDLPLVNTGPKTPTSAGLDAPLTTVTPPTPTDQGDGSRSPSKKKLPPATTIMNAGVSASGDTTLHRRVISDSASHAPSKLSNAIAAPLTPTIEESKTPGTRAPGTQITSTTAGGFFSSVFTAAQNAASTLTNTISNNPPRPRSAPLPIEENAEEADNPSLAADGANTVQEDEKKPLAVETLGSGNLSLDHLGISTGPPGTSKSSAFPIVANGAIPRVSDDKYIQRDEAAARAEDVHAARAVSEAYSENTVLPAHTIIAEDTASIKPRSVHEPSVIGDKTPPNDNVNVNEIERGTRRSGSVRSRVGVVPRRHRNSSSVTGNTITAALSAGHAGLANPIANGSTPKLTGFAVASKKRNRDFHQSFKSVPDDDYLIEDYSCALQREILLAGRLYVSEGHICFSSNILGWVTTVIISFDEVVSIEKESTAVVFPNAIAIQTLQARHTFRSLLSREATYELLIGIWKLSHPNLISSVNGSRIGAGDTGDKTEKVEPNGSDPASDISEEEEIYDEDEEENDSGSVKAVPHADGISVGDDEASITAKGVSRKASNIGTAIGAAAGGVPVQTNGRAIDKAAAVSVTAADFPGPATHAPTECADKDTHFEKLLKDEVIPAPLGKIYSMMFGPASGGFISKWLIDEIKVTELQLEDDKKGLTDENKTRFYSYIKPLYAAIGPKSTKCLSTENLDYLDLEKAVSVTITTQTPEVPSGNVFSVKTRYCLMWAPGNATRVVINCGIEWTGKSWLKGPIEKGANDGQMTYANELLKSLRAGVMSRSRASTGPSKLKKGKKKKGDIEVPENPLANVIVEVSQPQRSDWGLFEPLHGIVSPIADIISPLINSNTVIIFLLFLLVISWFKGPKARRAGVGGDVGFSLMSTPERMAAYEEMWRVEENELWNWLDERMGMHESSSLSSKSKMPVSETRSPRSQQKGKSARAKRAEDAMNEREVDYAIRVTEERLEQLKVAVRKRRQKPDHKDEIEQERVPAEEL